MKKQAHRWHLFQLNTSHFKAASPSPSLPKQTPHGQSCSRVTESEGRVLPEEPVGFRTALDSALHSVLYKQADLSSAILSKLLSVSSSDQLNAQMRQEVEDDTMSHLYTEAGRAAAAAAFAL